MGRRNDTYHMSRTGSYGRSVSLAAEAEVRVGSAPNDFLLPVRILYQRTSGRQVWSTLTSLNILDGFLEALPDLGIVHCFDTLVCKVCVYLGNSFVFHSQSNISPQKSLSMIRMLVG